MRADFSLIIPTGSNQDQGITLTLEIWDIYDIRADLTAYVGSAYARQDPWPGYLFKYRCSGASDPQFQINSQVPTSMMNFNVELDIST